MGLTINGGITFNGGFTLKSQVIDPTTPPGTPYTTWSGLASGDNPYGWTTQQYGDTTISIPWQWGGYNMTQARPTAGQTVTDVGGHTATISSVTNNAGGGGMNLLITLTSSAPGFATDTIVYIQ